MDGLKEWRSAFHVALAEFTNKMVQGDEVMDGKLHLNDRAYVRIALALMNSLERAYDFVIDPESGAMCMTSKDGRIEQTFVSWEAFGVWVARWIESEV